MSPEAPVRPLAAAAPAPLLRSTLAAAAAMALAACPTKAPPASAGTPAAASPPRPAPSSGLARSGEGAVAGRTVFRGPVPAGREPAAPFPECDKRVVQPALQVAADGGVANAFVHVREGLPPGAWPAPQGQVELDQRDCEFYPHVFGIRPQQALVVRNSDPLLHNVHARGQGTGLTGGANAFNAAMPLQNMTLTRRFDEPQVAVTITCDVHPWMRAYAGVVDHPFFAVTGKDGAFRLQGLPAGRLVLEAWHERLGRASASVEVADPGAPAVVELEFRQ